MSLNVRFKLSFFNAIKPLQLNPTAFVSFYVRRAERRALNRELQSLIIRLIGSKLSCTSHRAHVEGFSARTDVRCRSRGLFFESQKKFILLPHKTTFGAEIHESQRGKRERFLWKKAITKTRIHNEKDTLSFLPTIDQKVRDTQHLLDQNGEDPSPDFSDETAKPFSARLVDRD